MRNAFSFDRAVEARLAASRQSEAPPFATPPPATSSEPADGAGTEAGLAAVIGLFDRAAAGFERAGDLAAPLLRRWRDELGAEARQAEATLPPAGRAVLASAAPVLASADLGLARHEADARDRATAAEGARALAQLERLTRQGLPLEQALAAADGLLEALSGGGLLGSVLGAARGIAHERLAAAKLQARMQGEPETLLAEAPEAALVSPATLQRLEADRQALQVERAAAGQAELLAGLANGRTALSENQVLQVLGPALGAKAWQAYRRQQGQVAASAGFAAVERVAPGLARLLQRPETEAFARRLAVALQEGSERPEVWTAAEAKQRAEDWIELQSEAPGETRPARRSAATRSSASSRPTSPRCQRSSSPPRWQPSRRRAPARGRPVRWPPFSPRCATGGSSRRWSWRRA